jgi:hypothetical protein
LQHKVNWRKVKRKTECNPFVLKVLRLSQNPV